MTGLIFEISYFSDKEKTVTSALYVKIFPLQEFFLRRLSTGGSPLMVKKNTRRKFKISCLPPFIWTSLLFQNILKAVLKRRLLVISSVPYLQQARFTFTQMHPSVITT